MSLEQDLKKAKQDGLSMSKDKLIASIRAATQSQFPVIRERDKVYVVVEMRK